MIRIKKGGIEMDQIGYLILGLILLIILIYIISSVISPELDSQGNKVKGIFDMFS